MGIVVDLIFIALLCGFIIVGWKNGLTGSLIKILACIIAVVVSVIFFKPVANYVKNNTEIDDKIKNSIIEVFDKEDISVSDDEVEVVGAQGIIFKDIQEEIKGKTSETKSELINSAADKFTETAINVGSAIAIFLFVRVLLMIVTLLIKAITDIPGIKQIDKFGGIIYGFIEGMLIIYVILGVISFIGMISPENFLTQAILKSAVTSTLYNNNIILNILL